MRKMLSGFCGIIVLFFSTNCLAWDCSNACDGAWPTSEFCKCITECNDNDSCTSNPSPDNFDCVTAWSGVVYFEQNQCVKELQPFDSVFFNSGNSCAAGVCKFLMQFAGATGTYRNLGQCVSDGAQMFPYYPGTLPGDCGLYSASWIEACECFKANLHGD